MLSQSPVLEEDGVLLMGLPAACSRAPDGHSARVSALPSPSPRKMKEGFLGQSILLDILQCPPKIKLQSRASVDAACLASSCSFFLIPSLTPEQTFFSSKALGSTECLAVQLAPDFTGTHFPRTCLHRDCAWSSFALSCRP